MKKFKTNKKKVEEDMVMGTPVDSSGAPGTAFDVPQSVPGGMDTFALLGPGGTGKNPKKKKKKKKSNEKRNYILSFSDFFKTKK